MATTLALLLLVSFISTFVLGQLGEKMSELEFRHLVQVENQLIRLQAAILAEAETPGVPIVLTSPVTLGSGGAPPFGSPSSGYLQKELQSFNLSTALTLEQVMPAPPRWNFGSSCFGSGNGSCQGNTGLITYNATGNHTSLAPVVNGCGAAGCPILVNISGSFDQITVSLNGNNLGNIIVVVSGIWDNVTLNYGGSCDNHRQVSFLIYGTNDTYAATLTGCAGVNAGLVISTTFIGFQQSLLCPFGNVTSTDRFLGVSWGSSRNVVQNVTWWNDVGYTTPPHTLSQNGGLDTLTYANTTGTVPCAFTAIQTTTYSTTYLAGLRAHLNNRYIPPNDVVFDHGAVVLGVTGGGSIMVSPPPIQILRQSGGLSVQLTLVNALGALTTTSGIGTSAVITKLVSENTFRFDSGHQGNLFIRSPFFLNITTAFPQAWATFFRGLPSAFPYGVTCIPPSGVSGSQCLTPPPFTTVKLVVPMLVSTLTVTTVTVQVAVF